MKQNPSAQRYLDAIAALSPEMSTRLAGVPPELQGGIQEVRLRINRPLAVFDGRRHRFLDAVGRLSTAGEGYLVTRQDILECFRSLCGYSVHTHQAQITQGFITVRGGHRAGIGATAVYDTGGIFAMRDISSINLRIAREIQGMADDLILRRFGGQSYGTLLAGPPASGKTTLLREMIRCYAGGLAGYERKIAVVDERGELAAIYNGEPQNDLGYCTDILNAVHKAEGIRMATRALSPQMIAVDELGAMDEVEAMLEGVNSGVQILATVHAGSLEQLRRRPQVRELVSAGVVEKIVLLCESSMPGSIRQVIDAREF